MDRVAEPAPALASTTSVPAFWMRSVSFAISSSVKFTVGFVCTHMHSIQHAPSVERPFSLGIILPLLTSRCISQSL